MKEKKLQLFSRSDKAGNVLISHVVCLTMWKATEEKEGRSEVVIFFWIHYGSIRVWKLLMESVGAICEVLSPPYGAIK